MMAQQVTCTLFPVEGNAMVVQELQVMYGTMYNRYIHSKVVYVDLAQNEASQYKLPGGSVS